MNSSTLSKEGFINDISRYQSIISRMDMKLLRIRVDIMKDLVQAEPNLSLFINTSELLLKTREIESLLPEVIAVVEEADVYIKPYGLQSAFPGNIMISNFTLFKNFILDLETELLQDDKKKAIFDIFTRPFKGLLSMLHLSSRQIAIDSKENNFSSFFAHHILDEIIARIKNMQDLSLSERQTNYLLDLALHRQELKTTLEIKNLAQNRQISHIDEIMKIINNELLKEYVWAYRNGFIKKNTSEEISPFYVHHSLDHILRHAFESKKDNLSTVMTEQYAIENILGLKERLSEVRELIQSLYNKDTAPAIEFADMLKRELNKFILMQFDMLSKYKKKSSKKYLEQYPKLVKKIQTLEGYFTEFQQ